MKQKVNIEEKIKSFPKRAGVYLFTDKHGKKIYIGKAKNLKSRVKNYLKRDKEERPQIKFLMRRVEDVDYIVTDTEKEALLLENTLIKKHQPRYNIHLKDDKTFISIRIGMEHHSPGISATRHPTKNGARYFGPYISGITCRETIDEIIRYFKIRSCTDREFANRIRPCLLYDINRCSAPCTNMVEKEKYGEQVKEAILFLEGKRNKLIEIFLNKMKKASDARLYEEAAHLRDMISDMKAMTEKQKVVRHGSGDMDAIGIAVQSNLAAACVLNIRRGTLVGKRTELLGEFSGSESDILESFLLQWYGGFREVPNEIICSHRPEGQKAVGEILSEKTGKKVLIKVPSRGDKLSLTRLAIDNACETLKSKYDDAAAKRSILEKLRTKLKLPSLPDVIECLDISNIQGQDAYGSLVTFVSGDPDKSRYRLYKIQTIKRPDDYAMIREVLERRFRPLGIKDLEKEKWQRPLPDLLLIDGGIGQLNTTMKVLADLGLNNIPVTSIAKGESKGRKTDDIFLPGRKNPINFRKGSGELLFLMRIRDEAHRFGIKAHRKKRVKSLTVSAFDKIKGLGPSKRKLLISRFKSIDGIKKASLEEIATLPGFSMNLAKEIKKAVIRNS